MRFYIRGNDLLSILGDRDDAHDCLHIRVVEGGLAVDAPLMPLDSDDRAVSVPVPQPVDRCAFTGGKGNERAK